MALRVALLLCVGVLAGCSRPPGPDAAAAADLGFLRGFTVEDAAVRTGDGGQPVLYVLMSSKTAALQNIALAAGTELKGASVYVNDTKTLYWYRLVHEGRRLGAMVFNGSADPETVVDAQAADEPTGTVKCLLSFGPALATPPAPKP